MKVANRTDAARRRSPKMTFTLEDTVASWVVARGKKRGKSEFVNMILKNAMSNEGMGGLGA